MRHYAHSKRIDPETDYPTDASRQRLTIAALDRGHGYQKRRNPASLQELNDTEPEQPGYLETLTDLWLMAQETREVLHAGLR